jgi:ribosomal protein S18 acetylase RimI-like enzyme
MPKVEDRSGAPAGGKPPDLQIRHASPDDRAFVAELAGKVFSQYGSYSRYLTDWLETGGVTTLIGEVEDEPVGLLMLVAYPDPKNPTEGLADLLAIAVEPRFQSRGLGSVLLTRAIAEARRLPSPVPVRKLYLSVAETNARARKLFSRRGFRITSGEGIYPAGQRALHMVKILVEEDEPCP